jgi:nucleoside-diphosphate-sugar epimerase
LEPVAVFGASGFIGRNLVARLRASSVEVIVPRTTDGERVDIGGPVDDIVKSLGNARAVVNAAGTAHTHSTNPATFWPANATGARNIARAVAMAPGVARLVHISSVAVGAGGLDPAVADYQPFTAYGASKAAGEFAVAAELRDSSVDVVIVRPAGIGGDGSPGAWGKIRQLVATGRRVPVPDTKVRHDVVEIDDVVDFLISALDDDVVAGVFALAGRSPVTVSEYVELVGKGLGVGPRTIRIPEWSLKPAVAVASGADRSVQPLRRVGQMLSTLTRQRPLVTSQEPMRRDE